MIKKAVYFLVAVSAITNGYLLASLRTQESGLMPISPELPRFLGDRSSDQAPVCLALTTDGHLNQGEFDSDKYLTLNPQLETIFAPLSGVQQDHQALRHFCTYISTWF